MFATDEHAEIFRAAFHGERMHPSEKGTGKHWLTWRKERTNRRRLNHPGRVRAKSCVTSRPRFECASCSGRGRAFCIGTEEQKRTWVAKPRVVAPFTGWHGLTLSFWTGLLGKAVFPSFVGAESMLLAFFPLLVLDGIFEVYAASLHMWEVPKEPIVILMENELNEAALAA